MHDDPSTDPVERYLAAIEDGTMTDCDAFSPEVALDATVPNWRFTVRGDGAVRIELARWYAARGHFEELLRTPVPGGEVVQFSLGWEEAGVPHAVHQAHVIEVSERRILGIRVWCGGRWPATLLAEMGAAANV